MAKNEVIEFPTREQNNFPVTSDAVESLKRQRELLRGFVKSQLTDGVDFGVIPGTPKPTLYKPGAEKIARVFMLGVRVKLVDKVLERGTENFAMFTYQAEVYSLQNDSVVIAQCDGSCNSAEKKYATRRMKGGGQSEATPVTDVLNTLQKMAQKRAIVGAIILATGASDFFTQDIDDADDAAAHGLKPEAPRVQVSIPKVNAAVSQDQASATAAPSGDIPYCELCNATMQLTRNKDAYNCPNWKDQTKGKHSYFNI